MLTLAGIEDQAFLLVAITGGIVFMIVLVVVVSITQVLQTKAREHSRREIAAYIAEGTISTEEGERLLNAGEKPKKS